MSIHVEAIYENGIFRPIGRVPDFGEGAKVILTIRKPIDRKGLRKLRGVLSAEEAEEMSRLIREGRRVQGSK